MKRWISSLLAIAIAGAIVIDGYFLFIKDRLTGRQTATTTQRASSSSQSRQSSQSGKYKDGAYTGKATATQWGDVQVQATIKSGKLTAIKVLEYPNSNGHDKQINAQALPVYKSEALKSQSAKIQLVSGASETYKGFTGSLQNALDKAEA